MKRMIDISIESDHRRHICVCKLKYDEYNHY